MAMEMVCGQCQGRFLAEVPGSVVMCPHCGAHLQTPEAEAWPPGTLAETLTVPASERAIPVLPDATPVAPPPEPAPVPVVAETIVAEARPTPEFLPPGVDTPLEQTLLQVGPPPGVLDSKSNDDLTSLTETWSPAQTPAKSFAAWETSVPGGNDLFPDFSTVAHEAPPTQAFSPESHPMLQRPPAVPDQQPFPSTVAFSPESHPMLRRPPELTQVDTLPPTRVLPGGAPDVTLPLINTAPTPAAPNAGPVDGGVSPATFRMVVSYASAVTLACLYLLWQVLTGGNVNDKLESLPDLAPPKPVPGQVVTMRWVPNDVPMNPGHTLKLGESQRYGSLRVTPIKVVREPIEFVHFDPNVKFERMKTPPVLKLYLKFENVSKDQEFQPLDDNLVYTRDADKRKVDLYRANNFVCNAREKVDISKLILMYHRSPSDSFDAKGQKLSTELKPGETFETFLASSDEGLEILEGDLLWRVHFRKGYNPASGRGVTTLIEVAFHSDDIQDATTPVETPPADPPAPAPAPTAVKS